MLLPTNYYTEKYIQFCIEAITHQEDIMFWKEIIYRFELSRRLHGAKIHQDTETHNFWKDLFNIIKK